MTLDALALMVSNKKLLSAWSYSPKQSEYRSQCRINLKVEFVREKNSLEDGDGVLFSSSRVAASMDGGRFH